MYYFISLLICSWTTYLLFLIEKDAYLLNGIILLIVMLSLSFCLKKLENERLRNLTILHQNEIKQLNRTIIELKKDKVL